jgi:hypothetical protein
MGGIIGNVADLGLALGALVGLASGLIHGYTGFGGGLLIVPMCALLFGPVEGIAVAAFAGLVGALQLLPAAARAAHWREVGPLLAGLLVALPLGVAFLVAADPELVRRAIGAFVLASALVLMSGWVYRGPRGAAAGAATGLVAGGITGLAGTPAGPLLVLYFMAAPEPAPVQRANIVVGVGAMVALLLASLAASGGVAAETVARAAVVAPLYWLGAWGGARLFERVPKAWFRRVVLWLLVATGITVMVL